MTNGDRSNRIVIEFDPDRCLHTRSAWANCSLCVDSCPGEAIRIPAKGRLPSVDADRCIHCGQCLSACPLEAFESPRFTEHQLLRRIEPGGFVRLRCFLPYGELESLGSKREAYQLGTCLAALTPGVLFALVLSRTCELDTDRCASCSLFSRVGQTMQCNEISAFHLLGDWGRSANLVETSKLFLPDQHTVATREDGSLARSEGHTADEPDTAISVRSSIRALFYGRKRNVVVARSLLPLKSKKKHVPLWRQRLQSIWENRTNSAENTYAWPALVVDDACCRACGICMQLCPTGSIRHMVSDGAFTYAFVPGACVNCGLCIASCSAGALSRAYQAFDRPFDESVRFSQKAESCVRCGMPVLASQESSLCFLCQDEPDPRTLLERVRSQMTLARDSARSKRERD